MQVSLIIFLSTCQKLIEMNYKKCSCFGLFDINVHMKTIYKYQHALVHISRKGIAELILT